MRTKKPFDRLIAFLREQPKWIVGKKLTPAEAEEVLALAKKNDARVHELMTLLVTKRASFGVFDVEMYGEYLLRGKHGDLPNVIAADDVCIARNGAGDPYVWHATSGVVRLLAHEEGWSEQDRWDDVDAWTLAMMEQVVEAADAEQVASAAKSYLACLRFAIDVAGDSGLDDDARAKLDERD